MASIDSDSDSAPRGSLRYLVPLAFLGTLGALYAALLYAPTEVTEGDIQRMMYIHVPAAFTMYVAYAIVFLGSVLYLLRRDARWDEIAFAAAEVGTVFATTVMLTGPMWAKPVWGTWWVWDARLTTMFVLWLIFIAYLMLRSYGGAPDQVARYCAVLGIIAFLDIPIIHYSVRWWRTLHPDPKIMTEGAVGRGLDPTMLAAFGVAMTAALILFATLFALRLQVERTSRRLGALRGAVADRPQEAS